jgi:cyclopropane fatty-acyl-phospholipid synthase-like methyltransferase
MAYDIFSIISSGEAVKNPISELEFDIIISRIRECSLLNGGDRVLDLACGSGEFLVRASTVLGVTGTGVELQENYVEEGRKRIEEAKVPVEILQEEAISFLGKGRKFDAVCCMGASEIFGGFSPELVALQSALDPSGKGVIVIGDMVWEGEPDDKAASNMGADPGSIPTLKSALALFQDKGLSLLDMVMADLRGWDRMQGSFWRNVHRWAAAHAGTEDAKAIKAEIEDWKRSYLEYRGKIGWALFLLTSK